MRPVFLSFAAVTAMTAVAVEAAPARQEKPDIKTLELCLTGSPDEREQSDIVSEPLKTLFVDGVTEPLDEILCVARPREENEPGRGWFRLDPATPSRIEYIGQGFGQGAVTQFAPSPDGRYLAVAYSAEGHPSIEILDLPALLRHKQYKPLSLLGAYPGDVSIDRWDAGDLIVKSDMLLHIPVSSRAELFATEAFSWDVVSGKLKPLSMALNDPLRYFAAGLRDPERSNRFTAVWGLKFLDDQSAVAALRQALAVEADEDVRQEIGDLLQQLARTAELMDICISASSETLRARKILREMVQVLYVDGQTQPHDQIICVISHGDDSQQTWYRVDRSTRSFHTALLAGGGDGLTRLSTSDNGRFLAAQFASGDDTRVDIVDLGLLMRSNEYKKIDTVYGFRGSVSIQQWKDNDLHLMADVFPNRIVPDKGEGDPVNLPLLSPETFAWRSETSTIVPPSGELQDPIQYFCAGLASPKSDNQRVALRGLALLKDRSSVPCLESALSSNTNADIHAEIRQTIETIIGN